MRVTIRMSGSEDVVLHAADAAEEPSAAVQAERLNDEPDGSAGEAAAIGLLVGLVVAVCEIPLGMVAMKTGHVEMLVGPRPLACPCRRGGGAGLGFLAVPAQTVFALRPRQHGRT